MFDRTAGSSFVNWGLTPKDYYNNVPAQGATSSAVLLATINGDSHLFFTQYRIGQSNDSVPLRIFKITGQVQLALSADFDSNQATDVKLTFNDIETSTSTNGPTTVSIKDIFTGTAPAPTSSGSSGSSSGSQAGSKTMYWWAWLIMGLLLVAVIVLAIRVAQLSPESDGEYKAENGSTTGLTAGNQSAQETIQAGKEEDEY